VSPTNAASRKPDSRPNASHQRTRAEGQKDLPPVGRRVTGSGPGHSGRGNTPCYLGESGRRVVYFRLVIVGVWMIVGGAFGALTGWLAVGRNRSVLPWWAFACLTGPVALVVLLTRPDRLEEQPAIL
jgi:hypothetical protein